MVTVKLEDLVGEHELTGVEFGREEVESEYYHEDEESNFVRFIIDGVTYKAVEDPSDGYRSMLGKILVDSADVKNTFPAINVCVNIVTSYDDSDTNPEVYESILEFRDCKTGKVILSIGTDYSNGYYPCFVSSFTPPLIEN